MAALTSSQRIKAYSKALSRNTGKARMLIIVLCALGCILMLFHVITVGAANSHYRDLLDLAVIPLLAAAGSGLLLAAPMFKELYNRQYADVEFSLPITASERFRAKLLSMVRFHLLPLLGAEALFLAITPFNVEDWASYKPYLMICLSLLITAIFVDAAAVFCVSCCGSLAECIYTTPLLIAGITLLPILFANFFIIQPARLSADGIAFALASGQMSWCATVLGLDKELDRLADYVGLGATLLLALLLILAAYRIYLKRDGLQTGRPVVFPAFKWFIASLALTDVILLFLFNGVYYSILFGLLVFMGLLFLIARGRVSVFGFAKWFGVYLGIFLCCLLTGSIAYKTGGFGYSRVRPDSSCAYQYARLNITSEKEDKEYYYVFHAGSYDLDSMREIADIISDNRIEPKFFDDVFNSKGRYDYIVNDNIKTRAYLYIEANYPARGYEINVQITEEGVTKLNELIDRLHPSETSISNLYYEGSLYE